MEKVNLLSINVSTGRYREFVQKILDIAKAKVSDYVCVANVHMLIEARKDLQFGKIVSGANVITPDGKPLTWALRLLFGVAQDRVAGMDLLPDLLEKAQSENISVYFYGGEQGMLDKTCAYLTKKYPLLKVAGCYSPPFRKLTEQEEQEVVDRINGSGAQMVFVILGCPKQERWMASMKGRINAVMIGVGGALPVMIGIMKRAPKWMQRSGLEWLYRLMQEPGRLFKRYAVTNSLFIYFLTRELFERKYSRKMLTPQP